MSNTELSDEAEEYAEAIYRLQKRSGVARTKELAEELHVVPGSITNTIEHLEKHGLVEHEPYKGVKLTAKGEKLALDILRRHRLAERLLTDILDADWSEVHESACKLEHALTTNMLALLEKRLEHPKSCPHGNPIPTANGKIIEEECSPLGEINANETCTVVKITDERYEKLLELAAKGIKPDVSIHVVGRKPTHMILIVAKRRCTLSYDNAMSIWVKISGRDKRAV
jgi:DtxR family Mn-dependent transcriptional regulator